MDSIKYCADRKVIQSIKGEENNNINYNICISSPERSDLIQWFYELLKNFNIPKEIKERTIILGDRLERKEHMTLTYYKVFMLSLFNISLKLFHSIDVVNRIMSNIIEAIYKFSSDDVLKQISLKDIRMGEIFMLNSLDWNFNTLILSDYNNFFMKNFSKVQRYFSSKNLQTFELFFEFFLECALSVFITCKTPLHYISLAVILLAFDQLQEKNKKYIFEFLEFCVIKYGIDLIRIENFKKLLIEYIGNKLNLKIISIYPDLNIKSVYEKLNSANNCTIIDLNKFHSCELNKDIIISNEIYEKYFTKSNENESEDTENNENILSTKEISPTKIEEENFALSYQESSYSHIVKKFKEDDYNKYKNTKNIFSQSYPPLVKKNSNPEIENNFTKFQNFKIFKNEEEDDQKN